MVNITSNRLGLDYYSKLTLFIEVCMDYYGSVYDRKHPELDMSEIPRGEKMIRLLCNNKALEYVIMAYNYITDIRPTLPLNQKEDMDKYMYSVVRKNEGLP